MCSYISINIRCLHIEGRIQIKKKMTTTFLIQVTLEGPDTDVEKAVESFFSDIKNDTEGGSTPDNTICTAVELLGVLK